MRPSPRPSMFFLALVVTSSIATAQLQTCPGSGLGLVGGRFGDAFSLTISGPPGAAAMLASDTTGGPIPTPYGNICLGMTPNLVLTPLALDGAGHFGISGIMPLAGAFPAGAHAYVQAALAHPSLPGGLSLTNGAVVTMRPPRLGVFRTNTMSVPASTSFDLIDPVTDTVVTSIPTVPYPGSQVVHLKRHGWFAWPITVAGTPTGPTPLSGAFYCVDDVTGANVLTIPGAWDMVGPAWGVDDESGYLWVIETGAMSVYNRFWVKGYSLATGAQLSLGAVSSLNFSARGVFPVPGTSLAYVGTTDRFHVVDALTGLEVAQVQLPGTFTGVAFVKDGRLYCIVANQVVAIDMTTHNIAAAVPIPNVTMARALGIGPGSQGPALWAFFWPSTIAEIPLSTLTPITVTTTSIFPDAAFPSPGGTEMIFESIGMVSALALNVATHATTTIPNVRAITVLQSDTLTKAYAYFFSQIYWTPLKAFQTDPVIGTTVVVPVPTGPIAYGTVVGN